MISSCDITDSQKTPTYIDSSLSSLHADTSNSPSSHHLSFNDTPSLSLPLLTSTSSRQKKTKKQKLPLIPKQVTTVMMNQADPFPQLPVSNVVEEKKTGIWGSRVLTNISKIILPPNKKTSFSSSQLLPYSITSPSSISSTSSLTISSSHPDSLHSHSSQQSSYSQSYFFYSSLSSSSSSSKINKDERTEDKTKKLKENDERTNNCDEKETNSETNKTIEKEIEIQNDKTKSKEENN
jgi:hypothetical protein